MKNECKQKERGLKMNILLNAEVYSKILMGILAAGVFCKLWWGFLYLKLLKETENLNKTKNSKLRSIMLQFEKKYQAKKGLKNTELFVDKHVNQMRICGLRMQNANRITFSLAIVCIILSSLCGWWSYNTTGQIVEAMNYILEGGVVVLILCGINYIIDFENQKESMQVNIQEYLENVLSNKLELNNREFNIVNQEDEVPVETDKINKNSEEIEDNILFQELIEEIFP